MSVHFRSLFNLMEVVAPEHLLTHPRRQFEAAH